jgi:hypothetical protein
MAFSGDPSVFRSFFIHFFSFIFYHCPFLLSSFPPFLRPSIPPSARVEVGAAGDRLPAQSGVFGHVRDFFHPHSAPEPRFCSHSDSYDRITKMGIEKASKRKIQKQAGTDGRRQ